jgi:predicted outer membrane protein
MTARQIMGEIAALPPSEQTEVVRFACSLDAQRQLTGAELAALAERLAGSTDVASANVLREAIVCGFYGEKSRA